MSGDDRRRYARHVIHVPITVSTGARRNRVGVMRDLSASGMLFHSRSRFELGDRVTLRFQIDETGSGSTTAHVVRTFCDLNADTLFRFVTAVEFDAPLFDVEAALDRLQAEPDRLEDDDIAGCGS